MKKKMEYTIIIDASEKCPHYEVFWNRGNSKALVICFHEEEDPNICKFGQGVCPLKDAEEK